MMVILKTTSYCYYIKKLLIINKKNVDVYICHPESCGRSDPKCLAPFHLHSKHLQSTQT
jgi:hypothetical protein